MYGYANCNKELSNEVVHQPLVIMIVSLFLCVLPNTYSYAFSVFNADHVEEGGEISESLLMPCARQIADTDRFSMRECAEQSWNAGRGLMVDKIRSEIGIPSPSLEVDAEDALELFAKAAERTGSKFLSNMAKGALTGLHLARGVNKGVILGEAAGRGFERILDIKLQTHELRVKNILAEANLIRETEFLKGNPQVAGKYSEILRLDGRRAADEFLNSSMSEDGKQGSNVVSSIYQDTDQNSNCNESSLPVVRDSDDCVKETIAEESQNLSNENTAQTEDRNDTITYLREDEGISYVKEEDSIQKNAVTSIRSGIDDIKERQLRLRQQTSRDPAIRVKSVPDISERRSTQALGNISNTQDAIDVAISEIHDLDCNVHYPPLNARDQLYTHLDDRVEQVRSAFSGGQAIGGGFRVSIVKNNTELHVETLDEHPSKEILRAAAQWNIDGWTRPLTMQGMIDTVREMFGSVMPYFFNALEDETTSISESLFNTGATLWVNYLHTVVIYEYCEAELGVDVGGLVDQYYM